MADVHAAKAALSKQILGKNGIDSIGVEADPDGGADDVVVVRYLPEVESARELIPGSIEGAKVVAVPTTKTTLH